ncbi:cannabinoid receptor 1-like [Actinia tenebrosa]|uniref:Cannabinoid receptor 1-like n=1 Tax=Actinia tenebrosa TaxID=6105 RepID=A0A6P8HZH7_ACTTE|nr:cannabinoid receptor 1-like [Actinia tenebrosa]
MFNESLTNTEDNIRVCFSLKVNFDITGSVYTAHIITLVANSLTAPTAIFGNLLVLIAVLRTKSLYSPSIVLLCCLALSDLMVGLVAQPCFVAHKIGELTDNINIYCITRVVSETAGFVTVGVSTLTLTAISVERYLALKLHLRYREVITCKKVLVVAISFWLIVLLLWGVRFVAHNKTFDAVVVLLLLMALGLTLGCYYQIFKTVRRHENEIKCQTTTQNESISGTTSGQRENRIVRNSSCAQPPETEARKSRRRMLRYKKSTSAMVYILGVFIVCYVPILIVNISIIIRGYTKSEKIAYVYTSTILLMNSSVNPIIYCWRISDIRRAVKSTINKLVRVYDVSESVHFSVERSATIAR